MKNIMKCLLIIFSLFIFAHTSTLYAQVPDPVPLTDLKAGVAKVDITPPMELPLAGYSGRTGPATGIHDPLRATVIVFDDGETQAAIVSLDIILVLQKDGDAIRKEITKTTGIFGENIIINASHTHGSPKLSIGDTYTQSVIEKIGGAARLAVSNLRPVSIGYGEGSIDFNISRRWIDDEGRCHGRLNPEGICDHRVKVLRIDDGDDIEPLAIIMHAVCHPNVFRSANTEISGDFPGIAQSFVEKSFSNKTTSMFLQGCCGDIRSNMPGEGYGRSGSEADMTWCGWSLGSEAVKIATKLRVREQLNKREKKLKIRIANDVLRLEADEEKLEKVKKGEVNYRDSIENDEIIFPIRVLNIGNTWFITLPGQPVAEYGMKIEKELKGLGNIFVLALTTGDIGYVPAAHMISEGGYEASGPYTQSNEGEILEGVKNLVSKLTE